MEKTQTEAVHNSEASSTVSCVNSININELSKEKEEESLFGGEDGDDEDALSDDSLRLRLSDDEDVEQKDNTTNQIKISEFKSQKDEQLPISVTVEDKISLNTQEILEQITKSDNGESASTQKKHNSESSALLPSDECVSENKRKENNIYNSENSATVSKSNEKYTSKSNKDLEITETNNSNLNATSEQHVESEQYVESEQHVELEHDNLSTNNPSNIQNAKVMIYNEDSLKEAVNDKPIKSNTNTSATVSNSNDNNVSDIINKVIDKAVTNDKHHSVQHPLIKINDSQNSMDLIKSHNFDNLLSTKDSIEQVKSNNKNEEHNNITQNKNSLNTQSVQEETITILESDQNDFKPNSITDKTGKTNKNHNVNEPVNQFVDKIHTSTLQTILLAPIDVEGSNNESETKNDSLTVSNTKRLKTTSNTTIQNNVSEAKQEERETGRYKRKTARNAEEIIRKKYLNSDSDSSDTAEEVEIANLKLNKNIRLTSPPPLRIIKRNYSDNEIFNGNVKKLKTDFKSEEKNDITKLAFVEKFFQRNIKEKLPKLTQEELEELLIQKIAETITMRSEIGQLREQARISEKYQEAMRGKLQQLTKQVKDFEMVLNRNAADRRANSDKLVTPIKINRSVGLQVNFITEQGIQNLRQVQQTAHLKPMNVPSNIGSRAPESSNNTTRRSGIKTRSPRTVVTTSTTSTISQSSIQTAPLISTVTPAALVVAKPLESSHTLTLPNQPTAVQPILSVPQQIQPQSHQTIVLNGKIQNQVNRPQPIAPKPTSRNSDLIDLTDEEEKNKATNVKVTSVSTASVLDQQINVTPKPAQSFQRVLQTIPTNVAITTQQASIRVIAPNNQSAPTALNNINPPRLAYVMQSGVGSPRPVLITSNANQQVQIRPVTTCNRAPFSTVTYQTGVSSIANGTVRVITTPALSNKHPAPLPDTPNYVITPDCKLPPPAPSLKIAKVANGKDGIVLSWNMNLSDKYAEIASYQLYAYQEVPGVNPTATLWKKVGDVRALPLPMACTLTQFSEGNNYYFAVRAVDTYSRKGQYSIPGNISL